MMLTIFSFVLFENAPLPFMGHSKFVALMVRTERRREGGGWLVAHYASLTPRLNSLKTPIKDHNVTELDQTHIPFTKQMLKTAFRYS